MAAPDILWASSVVTLTLTMRTSGCWKTENEAVVKSLQRVPTPITRSASRATALAAVLPVAPMEPREAGWS